MIGLNNRRVAEAEARVSLAARDPTRLEPTDAARDTLINCKVRQQLTDTTLT